MINRYTDHAANERTYLAWIRTAIAIMAFGFLIEKFDLFISYVGKVIGNEEQFSSSISAELVGLALFIVGMSVIIGATLRFFSYKKAIESSEIVPYSVKKSNLILSFLMILMGVFLFAYMGHQILEKYI
ncbi:MAG: YidH family protein [Gammaproteobacteria bacterium]